MKFSAYSTIDANSDQYIFFLRWLVEVKDYSAHEIIDAVYYSHKYKALQTEYLNTKENEGGTYAS